MTEQVNPGRCLVSDAERFIFVSVPKAATTAIHHHFGTRYSSSFAYEEYASGYKSFTIVREPFDRLASGYIEALARSKTDMRVNHPTEYAELAALEEPRRFHRFVDYLTDHKLVLDEHVRRQIEFLIVDGRPLPIDRFYLLEHLGKVMRTVFNTNPPALNSNSSIYRSQSKLKIPDKKYITSLIVGKVRDRIEDVYEQDTLLYQRVKESTNDQDFSTGFSRADWYAFSRPS